ncbi:MAG: hypothetical protein AAF570_09870 [Bacteroidota bacterium]
MSFRQADDVIRSLKKPLFNPDGNVMFFTRNNFHKGRVRRSEDRVVGLKTYRAELVRKRWTNVKELPFNSDDYSVGHPCMGPAGRSLYFVSDKPGGYGGTDVYVTYKRGESWTPPKNLGPEINSKGDEMFPWVSNTGVLYFASNGHLGLGGLDIFRVTSLGNEMQKVQNMGFPINSGADDFGMIMDENSGTGFLSSNRLGGRGQDDIYYFRQKQIVRVQVIDEKTGEPIDKAKIEVFGVQGLSATVLTDEMGKMTFGLGRNEQFMFVATNENYLERKQKVSSVNFEPEVPLEVIIQLTPQ